MAITFRIKYPDSDSNRLVISGKSIFNKGYSKIEKFKFKKVNQNKQGQKPWFELCQELLSRSQRCCESMTWEPKHTHQEANFDTTNLPSLDGRRICVHYLLLENCVRDTASFLAMMTVPFITFYMRFLISSIIYKAS